MIPESYRPYETGTLLDLVSYGDPDREEPQTEERSDGGGKATRRWSVFGRRRRSRSRVRGKVRRWPRWRWIAASRIR